MPNLKLNVFTDFDFLMLLHACKHRCIKSIKSNASGDLVMGQQQDLIASARSW